MPQYIQSPVQHAANNNYIRIKCIKNYVRSIRKSMHALSLLKLKSNARELC